MFNKNKYTKSNGPKNKQPCVNPVFEKWIMELREDAIARDTQSKHTYLKVQHFFLNQNYRSIEFINV